jgi:cytosine/adenosine deaminase-related metal-dependent hydrolase
LLKLISESGYKENSIITFHNQETESENEMFLAGKGKLLETLKNINSYYNNFKPVYFNSLAATLVNLPKCNKTILVHNTYSEKKDIDWVKNYTKYAYWCLCPSSNLYIENKLPDINMFIKNNCKICLGTDSLASNEKLSILQEMKILNKNFDIKLPDLLRYATINGAEALDIQALYGSFDSGKKPGVNLLENIDLKQLKLKDETIVRPLV